MVAALLLVSVPARSAEASAAVNPGSKTYRLTLTLHDNNAAQGLSTTGPFMLEAQNP